MEELKYEIESEESCNGFHDHIIMALELESCAQCWRLAQLIGSYCADCICVLPLLIVVIWI